MITGCNTEVYWRLHDTTVPVFLKLEDTAECEEALNGLSSLPEQDKAPEAQESMCDKEMMVDLWNQKSQNIRALLLN